MAKRAPQDEFANSIAQYPGNASADPPAEDSKYRQQQEQKKQNTGS